MSMSDVRPIPAFVFPPIRSTGERNPLSPAFKADLPPEFTCGKTGEAIDMRGECRSCGCYAR